MNACSHNVVLTSPSSATSVYMRPSCAYWVRNGLTAVSSAAIQAVRRPKSVHPAQKATGTQSAANSTDSPCTLSSERPASAIQKCRSM